VVPWVCSAKRLALTPSIACNAATVSRAGDGYRRRRHRHETHNLTRRKR
jgi:hypothetical protein